LRRYDSDSDRVWLILSSERARTFTLAIWGWFWCEAKGSTGCASERLVGTPTRPEADLARLFGTSDSKDAREVVLATVDLAMDRLLK
jgi:hypothetical protein